MMQALEQQRWQKCTSWDKATLSSEKNQTHSFCSVVDCVYMYEGSFAKKIIMILFISIAP